MRAATRLAPLPLLTAALVALAVAGTLFTLYVHPAYAQQDSAPAKPTGLTAHVSHDSVTLTWNYPRDNTIIGYVIQRRDKEIHPQGTFAPVKGNTGSKETTYTDEMVEPNKEYVYRIRAVNKHGESELSNRVRADTPPPPLPAKPTGLSATASHDLMVLTWDDPQDDSITGYVILRRLRYDDPEGQFTPLVKNTGTAATTYTDDSVRAETSYTYRIRAINEYGTSGRSRWVHIDTPAAPSTPTPASQQQNSDNDDFADSTETTGQVAVDQSIVGRIESAGDVDWILVQADPGQWFTITLTGYGEGDHTALETPYQQAYHQPDGSEMAPEYALNKGRPPCSAGCTHVEVSQGGSRYVAVASRTEGNTGSYRLTVTLERAHEGVDGGVDLALDVSDDVDTRGFLRMLTPQEFPGFNPSWNRVFGAIPPHDVDWYRIDLQAGRAYRFGLRQSDTDLRLRLRDSTGTVIDSIGSGRTIHAVACSEGAHYIDVFRPSDAPPDTTVYVAEAAYTDGLATKALRGILLNSGQTQLDWQCYGIADSHQVQFRLDDQWTTLSADGSNPDGITLEYLNEGFGAKITGLPTDDDYAGYEFRITRVVDGAPTNDHREVSVVVIPDTPGNLRGGWEYIRYRDAATFEWNTVSGNNLFYEVQIKDLQDEKWVDLGLDPPTGVVYRLAGKTGIKLLAVSPRYVDSTERWGYRGVDYVYTRVRATSFGGSSPWSSAFQIVFPEIRLPRIEGLTGNLTGPNQATLSWTNTPDHGESNGVFKLLEYHVLFKIDGEWIHLSPGQAVNGVRVTFGHNNAVINGLPQNYPEYSFAVRHLGQVDWGGTPRFYLSRWSHAVDIPVSLDRPNRPEAAQTASGQVSVSWDPVAGAAQYRLRLWTVDRWKELDGEDDGTVSVTMSGTTATVSGLPGDYYWYIFEVQALGPNGVQQSAWSPNVAVFNQHRQGR